MTKNFTIIFTIMLFCCTAVSQTLAESFYGAIDAGQTQAKDACDTTGLPAGISVTGCNDSSTMFRLSGGYQITPMWGAEVSYGSYGKASLGTATVSGLGTIDLGDWQLSGIEISGTGAFPLGNAFSLIGKIGLARTDLKFSIASLSASSTNLAYGLGAQYALGKNIAIRIQYEDLGSVGDDTTGKTQVSLKSAGIVSRF